MIQRHRDNCDDSQAESVNPVGGISVFFFFFSGSHCPLWPMGWRVQLVPTQLEHGQLFRECARAQTWLLRLISNAKVAVGANEVSSLWELDTLFLPHFSVIPYISPHSPINRSSPALGLPLFRQCLDEKYGLETVRLQPVVLSRALPALVFVVASSFHFRHFKNMK